MRTKEPIKRAERTLRINSCQQPLAAVLPLLNQLLGSKEFIAGLARQGIQVNRDELHRLQIEMVPKLAGLEIQDMRLLRSGETMEKNGEVLDGKQFLVVVKQAYKDSKMPSITQWAGKLGVSYQFLSHVLRGDYNPGPAIAKALGYEQVYGFRRNPKDIRTAVAALAARNVQPLGGKVKFVGKYRLARKGGFDPSKKVRHGKKAQGKKK